MHTGQKKKHSDDFCILCVAVCFLCLKHENTRIITTYRSITVMCTTNTETQEWTRGKVIFFLHLLYLTRMALHCRMWIWTPFPWLIPEDPQPFPAPHRKPHALCITIQAYFGAWKQKIERETQSFPGSCNQSQSSLCFCGKRGLVPTVRNYQEENMKYLALSSPSSTHYFLAQTSSGKTSQKKKVKDGRERAVCFLPMIIWMLLSEGEWVKKHQHGLVEVRIARFLPSGDGMTRRGGTWDLIYAPWKWWAEWDGLGCWCRCGSDQSGRAVERWWSGTVRHLACINGQTTTGEACAVHACIHDGIHTQTTRRWCCFFVVVGGFFTCMKLHTHLRTGWP